MRRARGADVAHRGPTGLVRLPRWRPLARCLLYTSDAADERSSVDLGGRRILKKKKRKKKNNNGDSSSKETTLRTSATI